MNNFIHYQSLVEGDLLQKKIYKNMKDRTELNKLPRKSSSELGWLSGDLCRMSYLQAPKCVICKDDFILNKSKLYNCKRLNGKHLTAFYWCYRKNDDYQLNSWCRLTTTTTTISIFKMRWKNDCISAYD